jgi:hypothetical protein
MTDNRERFWNVVLWLVVIVLTVLLTVFSEGAFAYVTQVHTCPGGTSTVTGHLPTQVIFSQTFCRVPTAGQPPSSNALECLTNGITGADYGLGAGNIACTVDFTDDTTNQTTGNDIWYFNCLGCPRFGTAGTDRQAAGRVQMWTPTATANGGCTSLTFGGVSSWKCPRQNMIQCQAQALNFSCGISWRREPDVALVVTEITNLENMGVMIGVGVTFLISFAWGWRMAHGTNQV